MHVEVVVLYDGFFFFSPWENLLFMLLKNFEKTLRDISMSKQLYEKHCEILFSETLPEYEKVCLSFFS